jgi:hypothetical protein
MLRIKDIMTKRVYTVDADASAEEAPGASPAVTSAARPRATRRETWWACSRAPTSSTRSRRNGSAARPPSAI